MPIQKICECCGKEFKTPPRRSDEVRFCSRECKTKAGYVRLKCAKCGVDFSKKKSDVRGVKSYCSNDCYNADRLGKKHYKVRARLFKTCIACGKEFEVTLTRVSTAKYCSIDCKAAHPEYRSLSSSSQKGDKHWRWNGGVYVLSCGYIRQHFEINGKQVRDYEHRALILKAMLTECPTHPFIEWVNGEPRLSNAIEVHHIDRDRKNNDLSNLLAVTIEAHAQIHHRNRKPDPWECWPTNPINF